MKNHCKLKLDMTEPTHCKLRNSVGQTVGSYSYVPIDKVLKNYCSHDDIQDNIFSEHTAEMDSEFLTDYCDGSIFRQHSFFKAHPNALRLHFYEDEFEVVNPLGSKRNKHKLCAFYYSVGNLDKRHRSQQRHIHLALLVRYSFVKQFGLNVILKPLLDLEKLATIGFTLKMNDTEHTVSAALATVSGDNLSSHMMGGFTMSFNSGRICRYCMATYDDIKHLFQEDSFVLRTSEVHQCHLARIQQKPDDKATYGVNSSSPFDTLRYFDVTKSLPPDIMHDLLEGVIPLVMKLVICKAQTEKHITIKEINEELQKICIGQNDKANKPVLLPERLQKVGVTGSASQKWCLFRLLPFLMAHHIPPDCKYWHVFLLCREISEIVMAPKVRRDNLLMLDLLVQEFLTEMKDVFGDVITPKCHYLIHYARLMEMYGPLRSLWCMRFEGKHQYFKMVAHNCRNFVNIAKTLSDRHQFKQCWEFSTQNFLSEFESVHGKSVATPFLSLPVELQNALSFNQNLCNVDLMNKVFQRVSELTINSVKYAIRDVFTIDVLHSEGVPLFWQIKYILNIDTIWILCGKMLIPLSFDRHFHAYRVKVDAEWTLLQAGCGYEIDFQPNDTYSIDDILYVTVRHSM
ncbi:uncharacterized protein LOC110368027 isoform X1 [Fundulus heteroclitus]|uniref:uncharacterized protein LOC110368027 isoform X1 n=1 Tax=Fundulus heteroclitus TaxID=8078 RepID=UPI00165A22F5|nr:uncharacterized protein LOC110368027 isoform X1 [Fundulus heteroclitus]